jgi:hypothetical protein
VDTRSLLEQLEQQLAVAGPEEGFAPLAFLAAQSVNLGDEELHAARRRALLVLAAGGDPQRALHPGEPAVTSLARDLDRTQRRAELVAALGLLREYAAGLTTVSDTLDRLLANRELAWRWLACALLADEFANDAL